MVPPRKTFRLPAHFEIEPELREQFSNRPGHQRCVEGRDELLLVVHEVPQADQAERDAWFFWKRHDGRWTQPGGSGLSELGELLDRYELAIDGHQASLAVNDLQRPFGAVGNALTAAVTEVLIDLNYLSCNFHNAAFRGKD